MAAPPRLEGARVRLGLVNGHLRGSPDRADDIGLYGPRSEAWRLNRDAALILIAGPRSLLLQIAHPLIAEGVDQHSDFRTDPWRRLQATLRSYYAVIYGSGTAARAEIRRLNQLHRDIRGPVRDPEARARHGASYRARDPELSLWVHATLVESTLVASDAWFGRLEPDRRRRYYAETRPIGRAMGIPDALLPVDLDGFERYMADTLRPGGPIAVSPIARELARTVVRPPLGSLIPALSWLPSVAYGWTIWPSIGLLPERIRTEFGLGWGPLHAGVSAWLIATQRTGARLFPTSMRWVAEARAAEARLLRGPESG